MASTKPQFADLLYQALETELGAVKMNRSDGLARCLTSA